MNMERLKQLRTQKKLSQRALADKINSAQKSIDNWERNISSPSAETVCKLADFFECSADYLLGREDEFGNINLNVDLNNDQKNLLYYFNACDKAAKTSVLDYVKYLATKR